MGISSLPASNTGFIKKRSLFRTSGTFTLPSGYGVAKPLTCSITMVGGGGAGGGTNGSTAHSAGGGGGGRVVKGVFSLTDNIPVVIGAGGVWSNSTWGAKGGDTLLGVATEGNIIPNPFFWNGVSYTNTGYTFTTQTGSTGTNAANTARTDRPFITDAQHPLGRHRVQSQGIRISNGASVTQYRMESTSFMAVTANSTYYAGAYMSNNSGSNTVTMYIDWYTAGNALISSTTAYTTTSTSFAKYKGSGVAPANATQAKIRFDFNLNATSINCDFYAIYLSKNYDYAPYEDSNLSAYWTGTAYTSTINILEAGGLGSNLLNTLPSGTTTGYVVGGGGGGGRSSDATNTTNSRLIRGGLGAGWGGWASNVTDATSGYFYLGGDGGGAGGPAYRFFEMQYNTQTAGNVLRNFGNIVGSNQIVWRLPQFDNTQTPFDFNHHDGSRPISPTATADGTNIYNIDIVTGPGVDGYGYGGPGSGWWLANTATYLNRYDVAKYSRFGNGGAGSGASITTGFIDWYTYGGWDRDGDPGMVLFEWEEEL